MTFHDRLMSQTADSRRRFLAMPIVSDALRGEVTRDLYLDFLTQAYHHVSHTCPLLALAAAQTKDIRYRDALFTYLDEEWGHELWILDDIRCIGGDPNAAVKAKPNVACRAMVAYAYYTIQAVTPYGLLGMVHVLEGMSVQLAGNIGAAIQQNFKLQSERGVRYLRSHGALDVHHVEFFRSLVNSIGDADAEDAIVDSANVFYRLYGDIFGELTASHREAAHAH